MAAGRSACRFFSSSSRSPTVCGRNTSGTPPRVRVSPSFTGACSVTGVAVDRRCRPWSQDHTPSRLRPHHGTAPHAAGRCWDSSESHRRIYPGPEYFPSGSGGCCRRRAGSAGPRPPACGGSAAGTGWPGPESAPTSTGNSSRAMAVYQPVYQRMGTQPQGQCRKQFLHPIPSFPKKQLQTEPAESVSVSRKSGLL